MNSLIDKFDLIQQMHHPPETRTRYTPSSQYATAHAYRDARHDALSRGYRESLVPCRFSEDRKTVGSRSRQISQAIVDIAMGVGELICLSILLENIFLKDVGKRVHLLLPAHGMMMFMTFSAPHHWPTRA